MKKYSLILLLLFLLPPLIQAQGIVGEIFNQKQTQKKYLLQQIAALKVYLGYLEKGYKTVQDGTRLIGDIKDGDLNLHTNRFDSLKKVNPSIRNFQSVDKIISLQRQMADSRRKTLQYVTESNWLSTDELKELRLLYAKLAEEADKDLEELQMTVTNGELRLTDDQRLARIEKLYASTVDKRAYQNRLNRNVLNLVAGRKQSEQEHKALRGLYELH